VVALLVVTVLAEEILIRDYNGPEEQVINFWITVDSRFSGPLDLTVSIFGPKELEILIFTLDLTV
jgi:hypothetical protein